MVHGILGQVWNPKIVDELGAPDIFLQYLLQAPHRGRADVKTFMTETEPIPRRTVITGRPRWA